MQLAHKKILATKLTSYLSENKQALFNKVLPQRTNHFCLAVEDITQEQNASAIVRTAESFGIQSVHIIEQRNTYKIQRDIAKGSDKWLDLNYYSDTENNALNCINNLKKQGYQIIATSPHETSCDLDDFDITKKSALFFGTEFTGISDTVINNAGGFIKIPMYGFTESFNVSVAAGVTMQHLIHKLKKSTVNWQLTEEEALDKRIEWAIKCIPNGEKVSEFHVNELKQHA